MSSDERNRQQENASEQLGLHKRYDKITIIVAKRLGRREGRIDSDGGETQQVADKSSAYQRHDDSSEPDTHLGVLGESPNSSSYLHVCKASEKSEEAGEEKTLEGNLYNPEKGSNRADGKPGDEAR